MMSENAVISKIIQRPRKDAINDYEAWLKQIIPIAQSYDGHKGVNIIRPTGHQTDYTIVLHFESIDKLKGWLDSQDRKNLIEKVLPLLDRDEKIDIHTGFEFWFTPPQTKKHPAAYKQFLITSSAIYPLTLIVPWALSHGFDILEISDLHALKGFLTAITIVALMVYAIMPRYTRLVSSWLYD